MGKSLSKKQLRSKAINLASAFYKGLPCTVCLTTENTCWHHILLRSRAAWAILSPENIIPLCLKHHMFSTDLCAHSESTLVSARFAERLKSHKPHRHAWAEEHEHDSTNGIGPKLNRQFWQEAYDFWKTVTDNQRSYTWVCDLVGMEP